MRNPVHWRLPFFCRQALLVLAAAGLWAWAAGAQAHSSSNSYLTLSARAGALVLRTDLHLRDLDLIFDLDGNRDGQVSWGETSARAAELTAWMQQGLQVRSADQACTLQPLDLLASQHADGYYLSTEWSVACPGGADPGAAPLTLRYGLVFPQDNLHRGLLRVDLPQAQSSALFSPDQPEVQIAAGVQSVGAVLRRYVVDGVWHIWIGTDHILFLLSLLVLAPLVVSRKKVTDWDAQPRFRPTLLNVLSVVTAFTVAHSVTLSLSVLRWLEPSAGFIEPVIALSVVLAALNNLLGWFAFTRWRLALVFGLIHGFGFANVLLDLGLPARDLAVALGGFNLGVELGQIAIVLVFLPLAWWLRRTAFYRWGVVAGGSLAIAVIATVWLVERL
ncbi:MAG: HupE/UreJ family protein [Burkholderiaceae bacterium]|nr:HupE/UreJ family protein [Burkholderiaceae bacterium]